MSFDLNSKPYKFCQIQSFFISSQKKTSIFLFQWIAKSPPFWIMTLFFGILSYFFFHPCFSFSCLYLLLYDFVVFKRPLSLFKKWITFTEKCKICWVGSKTTTQPFPQENKVLFNFFFFFPKKVPVGLTKGINAEQGRSRGKM